MLQAVRFRLNHASTTGKPAAEREFSIWVGDLSTDVDDYSLYRAFAAKYNSIRTAKVILDSSGFSKGYGFVRFANEEEQKNSLVTMNGYRGLGTKSLKICNAVPRPWNKISGYLKYLLHYSYLYSVNCTYLIFDFSITSDLPRHSRHLIIQHRI